MTVLEFSKRKAIQKFKIKKCCMKSSFPVCLYESVFNYRTSFYQAGIGETEALSWYGVHIQMYPVLSPPRPSTQAEFFFIGKLWEKCNFNNQTPFSGAMAAVIVF